MERDFLGLSSKNVAVTVKEEVLDEYKNSAASVRGSGMQWSFPYKVSAVPQYLSFKGAQDERPRKTIIDPFPSNRFMTISTTDSFDQSQRSYSGLTQFPQRNVILDRKAATNQYAMTVFSAQHSDVLSVHPQEVKMFPVSNQMSTPILQSQLVYPVQNMVKPQPLGGVPIVTPASVLHSTSSIIGTTNLRSASKSSSSPGQLTIFYDGSVNVYDDISPVKAQAIMLLAGNGSPQTLNSLSTGQLQSTALKTSEGFRGTESHTGSLPLALPSPLSLNYLSASQPGGPSSKNELANVKTVGTTVSPSNPLEPANAITSVGPVAPAYVPSAVPQARKASLARFLEKRKERLNTTPYNVVGTEKSSALYHSGSDGVSLSGTSDGSRLLPAVN